jgi:hypothetical protein
MQDRQEIFVFGSNRAGRHGRGAALAALKYHGAVYGIGEGRTGDAYALPTKDEHLKPLSLTEIRDQSVRRFLSYVYAHPELDFQVTAVGCGLAGYRPNQIAPMFRAAPKNCILPTEFKTVLAHLAQEGSK